MTEYIDRKTLIKAVEDLPNCYNGFSDTYDKACIIGLIEELPSADVLERKKGKWIGRSENDSYPMCSECGCTRLGSSLGYCQKYILFCEHCGAEMSCPQTDGN